MICSNCGTKNKKGNQFCSKCGRPLPLEALPPQPASPKAHSNKTLVIVIAILAVLLVAAAVVVTLVLTRKAPAVSTTPGTGEEITTLAPVQPVATEAPVITKPAVQLPPVNVTPQVVPTRQYSPPSAPISQTGPWLIYLKSDGLYAANADGSGVNKIYPVPFSEFMNGCFDLPYGIAPAGDKIAIRYSVEIPNGVSWHLAVINLPSLEVDYVSPLLAGEVLSGVNSSSDLDPQVVQALLDPFALAWSPDGHYLAFVAALDGPSSDLYLYSTIDNTVKHLTSGPLEITSPLFTPDQSEIIYQVVETFGVGAGGIVASIRGVTPDGGSDRLILNIPDNVGPVTFLKVTNSEFLVMYYFSQSSPELRVVDLNRAFENQLSAGPIYAFDIDPISEAMAFIDGNGDLYLVNGPEGAPVYTGSPDLSSGIIQWDAYYQQFNIFSEIGWYVLDLDGTLLDYTDDYLIMHYSPDRQVMCVSEMTELWCHTMPASYKIADGALLIMTWAQDSSGFFYIDDSTNLYYVSATDFAPILVDTGLSQVWYIMYPTSFKTLNLDMLGWIGQ